jgi:hypothetical protein
METKGMTLSVDKNQKAGKAGTSISAQRVIYIAGYFSLVGDNGGVRQNLYGCTDVTEDIVD